MMRWMYIRNTYRGYIARLNNESGGLLIPRAMSDKYKDGYLCARPGSTIGPYSYREV